MSKSLNQDQSRKKKKIRAKIDVIVNKIEELKDMDPKNETKYNSLIKQLNILLRQLV